MLTLVILALYFIWVVKAKTFKDKVTGRPYLTRIYLTPDYHWWRDILPGVFLHKFWTSDPDRGYHNHPWRWAYSLILKGGYLETRELPKGWGFIVPISRNVRLPWRWNKITNEDFHYVTLLDEDEGAWSLFIAGPVGGRWGFLKDGVFEEQRRAGVEQDGELLPKRCNHHSPGYVCGVCPEWVKQESP